MANIRSCSLICKVWGQDARRSQTSSPSLCPPTKQRQSESLSETPFDTVQLLEEVHQNNKAAKKDTVLYLAYGSNLSAETFKGSRGIKPLSQMNVLVPSLELTFDLPGIPYSEPCFANTRYRKQPSSSSSFSTQDYHKDRWHKGLVGVVYEVTKADYATIIATEGGGSGYQDIVVHAYALPAGTKVVPADPPSGTAPFKAHTLFAPYNPPPPSVPSHSNTSTPSRVSRPDPSYAQPSQRYLTLITTGATEHDLPPDYRAFLATLRPYRITSTRQRLGQFIFLSLWMPIVVAMFAASKVFVDERGRLPAWMVGVTTAVFKGVWASYDGVFRGLFGDGERTVERGRRGGRGGRGGRGSGDGDEEAARLVGGSGMGEKMPLLLGREMVGLVGEKR